ncbi:MogA/MoaB family molybdenum cofactor biosynthesis protein [Bacillus piscicola]|uniref:MogA/MoaB family molybdenum cofactor biosynthesis protein n=1 Tax=Bacillus piscicola TaxID=1632684 RepID=UPI001F09B6C0|nr:MogA/MoaB family molybdenum cofactor biosynthesis protein [Bacillus piscicola]
MHPTNENIKGKIGVLTVSDTRTKETDKSGKIIRDLMEEAGHEVVAYDIVEDDLKELQSLLKKWLDRDSLHAIILSGGTGFSPRDVTYEAVSGLLEKEMEGFGELFRMLSYDEIGAKAMFSRAVGGSANEKAVFALPGSSNAVRLGVNELIIPILPHFIEEIQKK